jgi:aromatic-L-amino-acid/L-tryptophan decarboxylase
MSAPDPTRLETPSIEVPAPGRTETPPLEMDADTFRALGHALVDALAERLAAVPRGPVTRAESPSQVRAALGLERALPEEGSDPATLLARATALVFEHSLFNAHPRFFGYITAGAAPIGVLGDLLASAVNPNVGGWTLSPAASEIEAQTVRWIAELIGYVPSCGGLLVSGGNMANLVGFFAARAAGAGWDIRDQGITPTAPRLRVYASEEVHTWLEKATDLAGLGTSAIRRIPTDAALRMDVSALGAVMDADLAAGDRPLLVVGTAGSVSTGAVDPLRAIAALCRERGVWFHVDGAYGGFAASLPDAGDDLRALSEADSVAVDPHKWLYAPLEAGCALVRDPARLRAAFSYHPAYYHFEEQAINYVDYGPQNSRGFRALKVWLALQHAGAAGYRRMIAEDVALSRRLADAVARHPDLELVTQGLSITTFRYVPVELRAGVGQASTEAQLDTINRALLDCLQRGGELFVSNAVVRGRYVLRACIVNFRTRDADVDAVAEIVAREGREVARGGHARTERGA